MVWGDWRMLRKNTVTSGEEDGYKSKAVLFSVHADLMANGSDGRKSVDLTVRL